MNKITVSAPGKLMLLGEYAVLHEKPCLVTAVDQRIKLRAEALKVFEFQFEAKDVSVKEYWKPLDRVGEGDIPKGARFVEMAIKNFINKYALPFGVRILTKSDFSAEFGLGSSAAVTVCIVKALVELADVKLTKKEVFEMAYQTILDVQGKGSGFDAAAAVYGGTILYKLNGVIEPLLTGELPILAGYSGVKADTVTLIDTVKQFERKNPEITSIIYDSIGNLVLQAKEAILDKDWQTLGMLMDFNQNYLSILGVNSEQLALIIRGSREAGAWGAKLSGAGGGDCMIALADKRKRDEVEMAMQKAGGRVLQIQTNAQGVRVEHD